MDWEDYLDFDIEDIREIAGDEAVDIIQNLVEDTIEPLLEQLEFADSEMEREVAQRELDSTRISFDEAQSETESLRLSQELDELTDYMSQSYKSDAERIDRYLQLTGQGKYA